MAVKTDFSAAEWQTLRDAPHLVALAVATAGGSGLFGSLKEAIAPVGPIIDALKGENALLREVCQQDEMKAALASLRAMIDTADFATVRAKFRAAALEQTWAAVDLLKRKDSGVDMAAYGGFLRELAQRVANAAAEGTLLGFGGERVSEPERMLLAELEQTLSTIHG